MNTQYNLDHNHVKYVYLSSFTIVAELYVLDLIRPPTPGVRWESLKPEGSSISWYPVFEDFIRSLFRQL
jgi:hypothetical protein